MHAIDPALADSELVERTALLQRRWLGTAGAAVLLVTLVIAYTPLHGPICLSRTVFHIPCPGCGLTRSMTAIWRGEFILSLRYHPIGLPLFAACWWTVIRIVPRAREDRGVFAAMDRAACRLARPSLSAGIFGFMVALWALRLVLWKTGNGIFLW